MDGDFSTKFWLFLIHNMRRLVIRQNFEYILIFWEGRAVKEGQSLP